MKNKYLKEVIDFFGSQTELANMLGVSRQEVWGWYNNKIHMPVIYALKIYYITDEQFDFFNLLSKEEKCYLKNN